MKSQNLNFLGNIAEGKKLTKKINLVYFLIESKKIEILKEN